MALSTNLTGTDRRPTYYIKVAGVPVLYGSTMPPATTYPVETGAGVENRNYDRQVAILPNKGFRFSRKMDVEDHVITANPVDVFLVSDQQYDGENPIDPGNVYGLMGFVGASATAGFEAGVSITQAQNPPFTIPVDSSGDIPFSNGDVVHIGREAFAIKSAGGIDNQNKTITFSDRALLGTVRQDHRFDTATGVRPIITKPAIYFKGRRAIIFENWTDENGRVDQTQWVERWRGFITSEPEPGEMGMIHTIRLRVSPLTAVMETPLGAPNSENVMSLQYHTFGTARTDTQDDTRLGGTEIHLREGIPVGQAFRDAETNLAGTNFSYWNSRPGVNLDPAGVPTGASTNPHESFYDVATLPTGHPRTGPIVPGGSPDYARVVPLVPPFLPQSYTLNFDFSYGNAGNNNGWGQDGTEAGILGRFQDANDRFWQAAQKIGANLQVRVCVQVDGNGNCVQFEDVPRAQDGTLGGAPGWREGWKNAAAAEWRVAYLFDHDSAAAYPQTYHFRQRLLDAISAGWSNPTIHGHTGGFTATTVDEGDPLRPNFMFYLGGWHGVRKAELGLCNNRTGDREREAVDMDALETLTTAYQWVDPLGTSSTRKLRSVHRHISSVAVLCGTDAEVEEGEEPKALPLFELGVQRPGPLVVPTRIATTFYQLGECFITVDRPVTIPAGGQLLYKAFKEGNDDPLAIFAVDQSVAVQVDNTTVYRLRLVNTFNSGQRAEGVIKSFAIYPNESPIRLEPAIRFTGESVGSLLLKLLISSGGHGVTSSTYDVLEFGAGLNDGTGSAPGLGVDIDTASFLRIPLPVNSARVSAQLTTGESVLDVTVGLLRAVGHTIDIRTDDQGRCRLTAIPLGLPSQTDVIANLFESDIVAKGIASPAENAIFNAFEFVTNHDPNGEGEPLRRKVIDQTSVNTFGEEKKLTVEMRGVHLDLDTDIVGQLRPMFSRLRREFSFPRRLFRFSVRSGLALQMRVGGTYTVTHRFLRGASTLGVTAGLCRLRSCVADGWKSTAKTEFVFYGEGGAGWGPGLTVTTVVNATTIVVKPNDNSPAEHPLTGDALTDASGFTFDTTNRGVRAFVVGDMDNGVNLTIQSKANNQIVFDQNHPFVAIPGSDVLGYIVPREHPNEAPEHSPFAFIGRVLVV